MPRMTGDSAREHQRKHPRHEIIWGFDSQWTCTGTPDEDCDATGDRD
jgi:hypothetical protein